MACQSSSTDAIPQTRMVRPVPKPRPRKLKTATEPVPTAQCASSCSNNASDAAAAAAAAGTSLLSSRIHAFEQLTTPTGPTGMMKSPAPRKRANETPTHGKFSFSFSHLTSFKRLKVKAEYSKQLKVIK